MTDREKEGPGKRKPREVGRPKSPHYKGDNSGGFGNPPVLGQFKENNPGGGRPKGSHSMSSALRKVFASKVSVRRGDKVVQVTTVQALATRIRDRALTGSDRALFLARELAEEFGPRDTANVTEQSSSSLEDELDFSNFNMDEINIFAALLVRGMRDPTADEKERATSLTSIEGYYRLFQRDDGYFGIERIDDNDM